MSRFYSSSHPVQSTSPLTMTAATSTGSQDPNGGHCASPYLRRIRIPKLNTFRHHLEDDEDDEEWFEMQMAKNDLIRLRMNELKNNRLKDRYNNNNSKTAKSFISNSVADHAMGKKIIDRSNGYDVDFRNGNRCLLLSTEEENKTRQPEILETQAAMQRSLWFHPKHLFSFAPEPTVKAKVSFISEKK